MYRRLTGFVGNVPVRLVATFLVAILIPSLLVTGLGLLAVVQADHYVKEEARRPFRAKLQELARNVGAEWAQRLEYFERCLRDAHERREQLAGLRDDSFVRDVLVWDSKGLELVAAIAPFPELIVGADRALEEARALEASARDPAASLEAYENILGATADPAVELEALLGAARSSSRLKVMPRDTVLLLDEAIGRYGDTVDETGVPRKLPLLLRKLEILQPAEAAERESAVQSLLACLENERERMDPEVREFYRQRLEDVAPRELESLRGRFTPVPPRRVIEATTLAAIQPAIIEAARRSATDGEPVIVRANSPDPAGWVFAGFPADRSQIVLFLLLDTDRFLDEVEPFLEDVGIEKNALEVAPVKGRRAGFSRTGEEGDCMAALTLPPPFEHMEWRYSPDPASLPAGFRSFEVFTVWTFTWAVLVLVLTILVGTFLTLKSVLREMRTARMKSDFVSFISHELKTPLASIRMFAETLLNGRIHDEEEMKTCLQLIDLESERLTNLLDKVLDYSRIQSKRKVFEFASCSMEDVVDQAVGLFKKQHQERDVEVNSVQHISKIKMDRAAMVEVILNLLSNAGKYSPADKKIEVNVRESIDEITVEVIDKGVGIRKRDQRRVFDKFFRADDFLTRDAEGYGLGLAYARYIARQHKGDIKVSSQVHSGSVFTLCLRKTDVLAE